MRSGHQVYRATITSAGRPANFVKYCFKFHYLATGGVESMDVFFLTKLQPRWPADVLMCILVNKTGRPTYIMRNF